MQALILTFATSIAILVSSCSSSNNLDGPTEIPENGEPGTPPIDPPFEDPTQPTTTPLQLDVVGYRLIESLGGYSLELLGERIALFGQIAITTAIGSSDLEVDGFNIEDQGETVLVPIDHTRYSCSQGGEMVVEKATLNRNASSYSRDIAQTDYRFEQCKFALDGDQLVNGQMIVFQDSRSGSRFNYSEDSLRWADFSWTQEDGATVDVDASINVQDFQSFDSDSSRSVTVNRFESSLGDQILEQIVGGEFFLSYGGSASGAVQEYSLDVDGRISDQSSVSVNITTDPPMTRRLVFGSIGVEAVPFNGQISMLADDGSQLLLEATSPSDTRTLQVNSTYTDSAGNVTVLLAQNFIDLAISAP